MALKGVQYVYAEDLTSAERETWGIDVDSGLVAIETHASKLTREPKVLEGGIIEYIWSLEKKR
ncbi:hypothetical protein KY360_01735 [Candidatus Woesearchaeota archaeon]|nr:hypothetical protein [Candidatus Woesearchaeota archaeon]